MHQLIFLNNELVNAAKARVAPVSSALLYGRGVFTTISVYGGRAFLWPEHWARLAEHALSAGVDVKQFDEQGTGASLDELIAANRVKEGRAHVMLLSSAGRGVWRVKGTASARQTDLLIMTGEAHKTDADGMALTVSPFRANTFSPLAGVKSVSYLERILAWEEARARKFDEAVTLNERGEIVSATMANLFWVKDGTIHTPALQTGAVAGITRAQIIKLSHALSIPTVEGVYEIHDMGDADEIFLTSTNLGVAPINTFDFHRYTLHVGSLTARVREALRQLTISFV
ncbi:MAG: aminotransferase class IV [Pyrinomonadaceae bacterium]